MKKETTITSIKDTFFKASDDKTYPNYMALAQCICGKEINGEIRYPISPDKVMTAWGIKGREE
ncbi:MULTISPECIES: hypothetical protein [Paraclostridium]|uniref:hypothetical protein n=1 Tax=Paraclostridium TaxID=1849822 RepID=UPI0012431CEB|nr:MULTISPECIES: hypothetical protein [Paraclostridium]MBZ6007553.1 hypothetical protein [Paraclostridium bifermentans]MDM8129401.1 hypothetical protein [Paraclostridium benzoelyticum]MDU0298423.1 hypothetical protein [Paraclostridium sp. MRS3W1]